MEESRVVLLTFLIFFALLPHSAIGQQTTYTYEGPSGSTGDHLLITFTVPSPLPASKSFLSTASANVLPGTPSLSVINTSSGGVLSFFPVLSLTTFQLHTNAAGSIDAWFILGDLSVGSSHWQAYSMNSLAFIPGSDIPGAVGLCTGPYDYDQATATVFYSSCAQAPPDQTCQLAGNGQAYSGPYGWIVNPSNTNWAWWKVSSSSNVSTASSSPAAASPSPSHSPVAASPSSSKSPAVSPSSSKSPAGSPSSSKSPQGSPSSSKSPAASPSSSKAPSPSKSPAKSSPSPSGVVSKSPAVASPSASPSKPSSSPSKQANPLCRRPSGAADAKGKSTIISVAAGSVTLTGNVVVKVPSCITIVYNGGATGLAVGQVFDWEGYTSANTGNVALIVTIN